MFRSQHSILHRVAHYDGKVNFVYDANNNLTSQYKTNDVKLDYIWDYNNTLPIAQVTWNKPASGDYSNYYAYTSFEADGKGKWSFLGTPILATSATGKYCYPLTNYDITISDLDPTQTYSLTYWTQNTSSYTINSTTGTKGKKVDGWTYFEHLIKPAAGLITIHGTGNIDELRLYPKDAQMTTYTYEPLIGMTSQCDVNNKITYYDYDALGRLRLIKDQDKNVVKKICYNYSGEPMNCDASIFYNPSKIWDLL
jgi:YD repeat-containing protein